VHVGRNAPQADASGVSGLSSQPGLVLVCSILRGTHAYLTGAWMTLLFGSLQVPLPLQTARAATSMIVQPSSSDSGGEDPPSKRAHPWSFLSASSRYAHGVNFCGAPFPLLLFQDSGFEGNILLVAGAAHCWRQLSIGDWWRRCHWRCRAQATSHRVPLRSR
jgi:hypothetical protein